MEATLRGQSAAIRSLRNLEVGKDAGQLPLTALKQLLGSGVKVLPFPKDVMEACYKATMEYYAETSAKYPDFKRIYDDYKKFLDEQNFWFRVAENEYAKFMYSRKG